MKCDDCLNLLEEYIDGEAAEHDGAQISAHLITCGACAHEFKALTAEREMYARYDRELAVGPSMWSAIVARTAESRLVDSGSRFSLGRWLAGLFATPGYAFAGAAAVVIFAVLFGVVYLRTGTHKPPPSRDTLAQLNNLPAKTQTTSVEGTNSPPKVSAPVLLGTDKPVNEIVRSNPAKRYRRSDQSDVLFTDAAYTDIEDKETADHVERAQNLLRSIRNLQVSDDDYEVDVSYEKAMSRRLLDENVVLRRDAEMAGKFPTKTLLSDLEPFLIDIANLPDKTTPTELRAIKDRVQKTEIVAALRSY